MQNASKRGNLACVFDIVAQIVYYSMIANKITYRLCF